MPKIVPTSLAEDEKSSIALTAAPMNGNNAHQDPENGKAVRGSALRQVLAAFVAQLGTINTGMVFGFSAIAIPQLRKDDSPIPIGVTEESWIGKVSLVDRYSSEATRK